MPMPPVFIASSAQLPMENATSVSPRASGALAPALKRDFPEVQEAIRTQLLTSWSKPTTAFSSKTCMWQIGKFQCIYNPVCDGDPGTALTQPGSMVLTDPWRVNFSEPGIRWEKHCKWITRN